MMVFIELIGVCVQSTVDECAMFIRLKYTVFTLVSVLENQRTKFDQVRTELNLLRKFLVKVIFENGQHCI